MIFLNYVILCCTKETLTFEDLSYVVLNRETFVTNALNNRDVLFLGVIKKASMFTLNPLMMAAICFSRQQMG